MSVSIEQKHTNTRILMGFILMYLVICLLGQISLFWLLEIYNDSVGAIPLLYWYFITIFFTIIAIFVSIYLSFKIIRQTYNNVYI